MTEAVHARTTAADLARAVAEGLAAAGADVVFGVPGGGNNLELVGAAEAAGLRFVLTHTETGAAIMAGTYAELTRRPGACVVTRGPGAASAVNGVAQAHLDRQPLLVVTDTVSVAERQRVSHQQLDQLSLLRRVTKWSAVLGSDEPASMVHRALDVAMQPRRGAVHLEFDPAATGVVAMLRPNAAAEQGDDTEAARLLGAARRPVVLAGVGARDDVEAVRAFVRDSGVPVLTTYKAKGVVPESWPNSAGLLTGATVEGSVLRQADLVVAVGVDAVELIPNPWPYDAPVLSVAPWPEDHAYFDAACALVGGVSRRLRALRPHLHDEWARDTGRRERLDVAARLASGRRGDAGVAPHEVVAVARESAAPGTAITVDAGAHMLVAMPLWETEEPGEALISSGLATMGFALPAAVAAALHDPHRRTLCLTGDGGLGMALAELETLVRLQLPVTVVVFNDSTLSLIAVKQRRHGQGGRGAVGYGETDFARIAAGFAMASQRAANAAELRSALMRAHSQPGPFLVDVRVDPSAYPHVLDVIRGQQ